MTLRGKKMLGAFLEAFILILVILAVYCGHKYFFDSSSNGSEADGDGKGMCENDGIGGKWQQQRSLLSNKEEPEITIYVQNRWTGIRHTLVGRKAGGTVAKFMDIFDPDHKGIFYFQNVELEKTHQTLTELGIGHKSLIEYIPSDESDHYDSWSMLHSVRWLKHPQEPSGPLKLLKVRHSLILMEYHDPDPFSVETNRVASVEKDKDYGVTSLILCTGPENDCNLDKAQQILRDYRGIPYKTRLVDKKLKKKSTEAKKRKLCIGRITSKILRALSLQYWITMCSIPTAIIMRHPFGTWRLEITSGCPTGTTLHD